MLVELCFWAVVAAAMVPKSVSRLSGLALFDLFVIEVFLVATQQARGHADTPRMTHLPTLGLFQGSV